MRLCSKHQETLMISDGLIPSILKIFRCSQQKRMSERSPTPFQPHALSVSLLPCASFIHLVRKIFVSRIAYHLSPGRMAKKYLFTVRQSPISKKRDSATLLKRTCAPYSRFNLSVTHGEEPCNWSIADGGEWINRIRSRVSVGGFRGKNTNHIPKTQTNPFMKMETFMYP